MLYLRDFTPLVATGIQISLGMALVIGFSTSLVSVVVTRSASRASTGFIVGFVAELGLAVTIGFAFALNKLWSVPTPASPSAKPASTYYADVRAGLIAGLMAGLAAALAAGTAAAVEFGPVFGLEAALIFGLAIGLVITLITSQAQLLRLAQLILLLRGRGRMRLLPFLEEALRLQVLRQAGPVYQFRHAVLQDRLAKTRSLSRR